MQSFVAFIPGCLGAVIGFLVATLALSMGFHLVMLFAMFIVVYLLVSVGLSRAMKKF
jgi:hypothetical protein